MSIYAKLVAAGLVVLALVAFGWREHHAGYVQGAAEVQGKWDAQSAKLSGETQAAIEQAASDALANSHAAGVVSAAADQHQANVAQVHDQLTKRVQAYVQQTRQPAGSGSAIPGGSGIQPALDADGLRIWNDANAGAGGGDIGTSAGAGVADGRVSGDVAAGR
ncbi:hypothetical protein [Burkholderia stagnalis]|uniref:hypothetical protein n=1 Tax=Burkholderia stagnalis TaxID=1503054 RepID=UPI000F56E414|nr:hypothetical protein [Burkholderia stagnalis]RQQ37075.1 hypothetical protein DF163_01520 [Burkholderia stagnalis]RQQ55638.1 hypothetical protein DF162_01675 [Burkholderia stagnalis]RQY19099.1 hypothetical protein DF118_01680 [Burkholderia stagnalis]RQY64216.1 hypothetical protein DF112_00530 [Burkholderia stagnalis]RQY70403.1 hypothetical protein DF109_02350 [Burkholderia stagnalis]